MIKEELLYELISFGDRISTGTFKLHSRFTRNINFVNEEKLICLTNKEDNVSPINIVIKALNYRDINSIKIDNNSITIRNSCIKLNKNKIYNSLIELNSLNEDVFETNLKIFQKCLLRYSPCKSLTFLLDKERENNFHQGFEKELLKKMKLGVRYILENNLLEGVKKIKGAGSGLTPSGDDFIAGLLFGLYILEKIYSLNLKEIREEIYNISKSNNIISNTFLYLAKEGSFFKKLKELVLSLFYSGEKEVFMNTKKIMNMGATSGSDLATGLLITLRELKKISYEFQREVEINLKVISK